MSTCFCMGPQNGEPLCPCQMRKVVIRNGRYIYEQDLGPVRVISTPRNESQLKMYQRTYGGITTEE